MPRVASPRKPRNQEVRSRAYLTEMDVTRLAEAAQASGRYGQRNACMILLAFRHGLRVSELIALRWDMVDLDACLLHGTGPRPGVASSHPLRGSAVRGLRCVKHDHPQSPYVFVSEREAPMTDANVRKMLARMGRAAGFDFLVHPHMLRHATGAKLANNGQDTRALQYSLGHKEHSAHGAVYGAEQHTIPQVLERLTPCAGGTLYGIRHH